MQPVAFTNDAATPAENMVYSQRQIQWAIQAHQDLHWRYKVEGNEIVIRDSHGYIPGLRFRFPQDLKGCSKEDMEEAITAVRVSLAGMFPLTSDWEFRPNLEK